MKFELNKEILKVQVKILRKFLKEGGQDISQTSAYNCLAKMYSFRDWNHLSAYLNEEKEGGEV